jgi:hypothetical protein
MIADMQLSQHHLNGVEGVDLVFAQSRVNARILSDAETSSARADSQEQERAGPRDASKARLRAGPSSLHTCEKKQRDGSECAAREINGTTLE